MASLVAQDMRAHLAAYLAGRQALAALEDWLLRLPVEEIDSGDDVEAKELLYEFQLRLAEYGEGLLSEQALRMLLTPLAQPGVLRSSSPPEYRALAQELSSITFGSGTTDDRRLSASMVIPGAGAAKADAVCVSNAIGTLSTSIGAADPPTGTPLAAARG